MQATTSRWQLLGFDALVDGSIYAAGMWDTDSRTRYLLREDTKWPMSTDYLICPSLFSVGEWHRELRVPFWNPGLQDDWDGLWRSLDLMRTELRRQTATKSFIEIALEIYVTEELLSASIQRSDLYWECVPETVPNGATLIGYDVSDAGGISGLSDCGYTPEEKSRLAPVWGLKLNDDGLFNNFEDAFAFKPVCDERVLEHAPFYVYRLWRLK